MARTPSKATKKAATKAKKQPVKHDLKKDQSYVGCRVSKNFDGEIYSGTVDDFIKKDRLWAVKYDDGDAEEMDWDDLSNAMNLHDKKNKKKNNKKISSNENAKGKGKAKPLAKAAKPKRSPPREEKEEPADAVADADADAREEKISAKKKKKTSTSSPRAQDVTTEPVAPTFAVSVDKSNSETTGTTTTAAEPPSPAPSNKNYRVIRTTYPSNGSTSHSEKHVVGEYATRKEANKAARDEMESTPQFEDWGEEQFRNKPPPYSSADGQFEAIADEDEYVDIYVVDVAKEEGREKQKLEAAMASKPPTKIDKMNSNSKSKSKSESVSVSKKLPDPSQRKFGRTTQSITVDPNLFARNPCRIPGGKTRLPSSYPNHTKGKGSFGFLIQRLSDRNYAMRAMCLDGYGAEYNTYKKASANYISVVWYPPNDLNDHKKNETIVDGCHLDLIDPSDGKTYLTGPNLESAIVNASEPVECVFLNGAQSNPGSAISADDIASAISKCNDSLQCLALTECKLNAAIIGALASCSKLRGVIIENCQLWGEGDNRPTDAGLSVMLSSCPELRWCYIKSSIFGADCWNSLAEGSCPELEVLWVDAPLHTQDRIDTTRGDHNTIRTTLERRADKMKLCMINPDDMNKSRYLIGGGKHTDRLDGRARTEEEKKVMRAMQGFRGGSYLSKV